MIRPPSPGRVWAITRLLADLYRCVAGEFIGWHDEVGRGRALADAPGGVVDRSVARAEPPTIRPAIIPSLLSARDASEMRTYANDHQPFRFFDPSGIRLRVAQV